VWRVRYTVTGEPARRGIRHCRDCQRFTGSAFETIMFFPTASVELKGELKSFTMSGGSGQSVARLLLPFRLACEPCMLRASSGSEPGFPQKDEPCSTVETFLLHRRLRSQLPRLRP
jgi:hypothetical protein